MFASVCPIKRPHSPEPASLEMRAALCCAAMKLDRTLTDDIVSRQVTPAIKASNNRLCCNTMLATQLQQPPSSSQPALPMQLSGSLPMVFSSITACKLRCLHASGISLDFVGIWGRFRAQTPLQPSLGTSIVFLFRRGCYSGSTSHSRHWDACIPCHLSQESLRLSERRSRNA